MQQLEPTGAQVNLYCDDVERCVQFYGALGLPEAFRAEDGGVAMHVEVQAPGMRIGLTSTVAIAAMGMQAAPRGSSSELVLWCDDVDVACEVALAAGAELLVSPERSQDGRLRYCWLHDPDGHVLKLVQHR